MPMATPSGWPRPRRAARQWSSPVNQLPPRKTRVTRGRGPEPPTNSVAVHSMTLPPRPRTP